jgi:hypothetical protein
MAKQEVGLKIDVDVKSVGNMKQELRAATQELIAVNEKFGATSTQAVAAAKRVASLKDAIGDAKALADTFNPDKKFVALGGAVQGAVAGFSALQGAIGLFGSESKDVEKILLKVQSAMALQQGISGIAGAMDSFKLLAGTIKTQVVVAFTTLRGAMMATGIGLITSAVAFLVTNFDAVKKKLGELFPALKGTGDLMDRLKQIAMGVGNAIMQFLAAPVSAIVKIFQGDFKGAIDAVKNGVSFVKNFREGEKKEIESQAAEAEAARQKELEKQKAANDKKLAEQRRINEELRKEREAAEKQYNDFIKSENEKRLLSTMSQNEKELYELRKKFQAQYDVAKKYGFDTKQLNELQFKEGLDLVNKSTAEDTKAVIDANAKKLGDFTAMVPKMATLQTTLTANQQTEANIRKGIDEEELAAKQQMADQTAGILNGLSNVLGAQTKAGKAAAIAAIVIEQAASISRVISNTAAANAKAVAASPLTGGMPFVALNTVSAAVSIASSIANARKSIQQINSNNQNVSGGGGGGGISTAAPVAPALAPQVEATQVNTAAVNQMGNRAARAYVLNSDIQNEQQRNAYIDRNASIGNP